MCNPASPNILILDDEPFMLKLLSHMLGRQGYRRVSTAQDGAGALLALDGAAAPDLILCDLNMPQMDGIEFIRKLVERGYAGSLILVSGMDPRLVRAAARLARAHRIQLLGKLRKPVLPEDLAQMMAQWRVPQMKSLPPRFRAPLPRYGAAELRDAMARGELVNHYQPKVALADGRVAGVEALVRWAHPRDGLVYPDQFIELAERHGLIDDLTRLVLLGALAQARRWADAGLDLTVAVNISMDNLHTLDFVDFVEHAASDAGVAPERIILEVTESRLMLDLLIPLEILTRLRMRGFGLAIDDFGTGHSSLAQLRDFPFDELKIDRGFVHGAATDSTLGAICQASLDLARKLGLKVVAEGVEDQQDWDYLCQQGGDLAQGYFIAKPMAAAEVGPWAARWHAGLKVST